MDYDYINNSCSFMDQLQRNVQLCSIMHHMVSKCAVNITALVATAK